MPISFKRPSSYDSKAIDSHKIPKKLKEAASQPRDDTIIFHENAEEVEDRTTRSDSDLNYIEELSPYNNLLNSLHIKKKRNDTSRLEVISNRSQKPEPSPDVHASSKDRSQRILLEPSDDDEASNSSSVLADDDHFFKTSDPYHSHFVSDSPEVASRLKATKNSSWIAITSDSQNNSDLRIIVPRTSNAENSFKNSCLLPESLWLKHRLLDDKNDSTINLDTTEEAVSPYLLTYHDILFGKRASSNAASLRRISCLHALNHVFKTRDRIIRNSERRAHLEDGEDLEVRDQGFTRPKVLFLLETRQNCYKYASMLSSLAKPDQEEHKKRLANSFYLPENKFKSDDPEDFRELFEGNDDNNFRLGIKLTRKTIKYFASFYSSDILLASPLGLRSAIESRGRKDYDFLSSVEMIIIDQADAMLMQNWEHVDFVLDHLNLQPKEAHGCDFSRVRKWYLDGDAQYYRQTVVYSAYVTPEINKIFTKYMRNIAGKIKFQPKYQGSILDLDIQVKQTFLRLNSATPAMDPDVRFEVFTSALVPSISKAASYSERSQGILVFIPSYFDFVRIRNHLSSSGSTQNLSFGAISEYSEHAEVRRARSLFVDGRYSVLLYTGRAHHFRRYRLKGVKEIIIYSLPDNAMFYRDIVSGFLGSSIGSGQLDQSLASVRVLFSEWDALKLERVVGTTRMKRMLRENSGDTFEFR